MFRETNSNIKIMHEKLNKARIMCNLKYKNSIKKNVGQGELQGIGK